MKESFRLGRVAGIEIGANWSVVVIAWLIVWTLAAGVLPELEPGRSTIEYWAVGLVAGVLFFASLLLHELGHAIVARRHGVEVEQITLWLFGGVAKLKAETTDAGDELRIGGVGPLVSLGLGAAFLLLAFAVSPLDSLRLIRAGLLWLGTINIVLGVFNLLPAFPLDGGRVLRALLWRQSGDRVRATMTAAGVGQVVAFALMALGLLAFAGGAVLSGLWLVFLGWFVLSAARAEAMSVTARELLDGVRIRDVMTAQVVSVPARLTVSSLVDRYVLGYRHSAYPVVDDDGALRGLVTLDAVRRVPVEARAAAVVGDIAYGRDELLLVGPDDPLGDLAGELGAHATRRALVVDRGALVGIVTTADVAHLITAKGVARGLPV